MEDFAEVCLGKMLDRSKNRGKPRPYLRNINVRWFEFDLSDVLEMPFEDDEVDRYTARSGDLMVCEGGYPGRAAIWSGEPIYFQKAVHRVRCHEPQRARWLLYFLLMSDLDGSLKEHFTGTGIQHFTAQAFKKMKVPLPPLAEQKRIVAILDEAFEGIATATANADRNFANAQEVQRAYLDRLLVKVGTTSLKKRLAELCELGRPITYGVIKLGDDNADGVPCLRTSNVRWLKIDITGIKRIKPSLSREYGRTVLKGGEVLVNVRGTLGGVAVAQATMAGWNVSREVAVVPVNQAKMAPEFLAYWIGARPSQQWLSGVETGAAYVGVNIGELRTLPVPLPTLAEQAEAVARLQTGMRELARLEAIAERKLAALAELKQSLLARAFSGELTAADPLAA